jgi:hypothetical protein
MWVLLAVMRVRAIREQIRPTPFQRREGRGDRK